MPPVKISWLWPVLGRWSFGGKIRERCWKKIAQQLRHTHMPLWHCFSILKERAKSERSPVQYVYGQIERALTSGHTIGTALAPFASHEEIMLIDSGQTGGERMLADGFFKAADLLAKRREIRGKVIGGLAYPVLLLAIIIVFLCVISTVLIPQLSVLSDPQTWTGAAAVLYAVATFVASPYGAAAGVGVLALAVLVSISMSRWAGRSRRMADRFPPWSIYRVIVGVSWLYATAILLQTGVKLVTIIDKTLKNPHASSYLKSRLRPVLNGTIRGLNLGEALHQTHMNWPDTTFIDDLRTYATLPSFNDMLGSIADDMIEETMERVDKGSKVINTLCILLIVGGIVLLLIGLGSIQTQITQNFGA